MGDDESGEDDDSASSAPSIPSSLKKEFFGDLIARMIPGSVFILIVFLGNFDEFSGYSNWQAGLLIGFCLVTAWVVGSIIDILFFHLLIYIFGEKALLDYKSLNKGSMIEKRRLQKDMAEMAMFRNLACVFILALIASQFQGLINGKPLVYAIAICLSLFCWLVLRWRAKRCIEMVKKSDESEIKGLWPRFLNFKELCKERLKRTFRGGNR